MSKLVVPLVLVACGSPQAAIDAPPDAPECTALAECVWLDDYQRHIVGSLAGERDITPGIRLAHRESVVERDAARAFLLAELSALGYDAQRQDYATGANVVARLEATGGDDRLIVVGAHFDSVPEGPGAADNATGVAIVLAAARYLRDVPVRQHPIAFVMFDEEELGLVGSRAYVRSLIQAQARVGAAHIFDMLSFDGDRDRTVELWSASSAIAAQYERQGPAAGTPIVRVAFSSSDHQAFLDSSMAATGIGEEFVSGDHTPHYHMATDTYANVDFGHLATVTHLALAVLEAALAAP